MSGRRSDNDPRWIEHALVEAVQPPKCCLFGRPHRYSPTYIPGVFACVSCDAVLDRREPPKERPDVEQPSLSQQNEPRILSRDPAVSNRRAELLAWLREREAHHGLSASQIADVSGIYDSLAWYRAERAHDDLGVLCKHGLVRRVGRPSTWWPS